MIGLIRLLDHLIFPIKAAVFYNHCRVRLAAHTGEEALCASLRHAQSFNRLRHRLLPHLLPPHRGIDPVL